ncbi:MAG: acetyl-CoA carboxylase, carboxyltransferase subunit beta [Elusimicrobia bacterium]|nr:acetyl-CoA carboxylase, carboxyltransferase subunit beta [Candidatus Obscuribacterium magneticum]
MAPEETKGQESKDEKKGVPEGLWTKCTKCDQIVYNKELQEKFKVCPKCGYCFPLAASERVAMLLDAGSEKELDSDMESADPLEFLDGKIYKEKLASGKEKSKLNEAVWIGTGTLDGLDVVLGVMDFNFMGGSMGSVVGEKITRACELALEKEWPLIVVSTSGGARMQEGILSLMQMAKISAALGKLRGIPIPYISVLADPTTGGVTASFAMLGDVNYAEPGALIGFAGPRVIEQTIRQTLPEGFQRSEFLLKHGMLDRIIPRSELKKELRKTLRFWEKEPAKRK